MCYLKNVIFLVFIDLFIGLQSYIKCYSTKILPEIDQEKSISS